MTQSDSRFFHIFKLCSALFFIQRTLFSYFADFSSNKLLQIFHALNIITYDCSLENYVQKKNEKLLFYTCI